MNEGVEVVTTWEEFRRKWDGRQNLLLRGEMFPHSFTPPGMETVLDEVRKHEKTRIQHAYLNEQTSFYATKVDDFFPEFVDLPIEQALKTPAGVANFEARNFAGPGQVLEGINPILDDWYHNLSRHGFDYTGTLRVFFYSCARTNTGYHYDDGYVLAWQITGTKRFCWLKEPDKWCPPELRRETANNYKVMRKPEELTPDDVIECEMHPGDVLWNVMLTPHWVYSLDEPTFSINLVHNGLRCDGRVSDIGIEYDGIVRERARERALQAA